MSVDSLIWITNYLDFFSSSRIYSSEVKVSRNAVPVKELLPVRRSG